LLGYRGLIVKEISVDCDIIQLSKRCSTFGVRVKSCILSVYDICLLPGHIKCVVN